MITNELVNVPERTNVYRAALKEAMGILADDERTIFLGQTVGFPGSRFTFGTLEDIPAEKRIELPIMEDTQMGMSIGMALEGYIPVTVYPRVDFLLLASNQLVNHLDKMHEMSRGQHDPHVIIRAVVGSRNPIYPGPQHCQDHTGAFTSMLQRVNVTRLTQPEQIVPAYQRALERKGPSLLIEYGDLHFK
ncbi:hypothetical protein CO038_01155 [Candidatus Pacearchaeota archaeon CG_4_9_14_0_2_um_filter_39_13]|nr:hypothetical protein [Candidatus Pacearchaeota archaeon]PJC44901.1 MAG: hypothetical protein CO038_01155 [Candidatus Pacearchaeota archaeon CG_4_9_14_0_2_um_filter_39_13]